MLIDFDGWIDRYVQMGVHIHWGILCLQPL